MRDFSHFPMATGRQVGPSGIPGVALPPPAEFAGASKRNSPIEARAGAMQLVGQQRRAGQGARRAGCITRTGCGARSHSIYPGGY
jgi:hypothetical protein